MPIYEYRCEHGHQFEVMQKMTDDPVPSCTRCEAPVQRVFHPVAVHFKGKGFYNTDYGTRRRNRELERSGKDGADKTESKAKDVVVVLVLVLVVVGEEERVARSRTRSPRRPRRRRTSRRRKRRTSACFSASETVEAGAAVGQRHAARGLEDLGLARCR